MNRRSPLISDDPIQLLDHLEHCALTDPDRHASVSELKTDLVITGSEDALEDEDVTATVSDFIEAAVDAAFTEAEFRLRACTPDFYPFKLDGRTLVERGSKYSHVYTFLLGLTLFGEAAVPNVDGAKIFEDVCGHASSNYLGCPERPADSHVFGFPRRIGPKDFCAALEDLCSNRICEGRPDDKFPTARNMKDAGLDIITWRGFPDRRSAKMIVFGHCATGKNWWGKRHELQPGTWCRTWLTKTPHLIPVKMFFVPHAISTEDWAELGYEAGIIFDRFRITHFAEQNLPRSLRRTLRNWSRSAFKSTKHFQES